MLDEPTADQFWSALGGRIYRPEGVQVLTVNGSGWSGSGDDVESLNLKFLLGPSKESVIIESSIEDHRHDEVMALQHLAFEIVVRGPTFPTVLDRSTVTIAVDGQPRRFTAYTAGTVAVATGSIDDLTIMVRCAAERIVELSLARMKREDLEQALGR